MHAALACCADRLRMQPAMSSHRQAPAAEVTNNSQPWLLSNASHQV